MQPARLDGNVTKVHSFGLEMTEMQPARLDGDVTEVSAGVAACGFKHSVHSNRRPYDCRYCGTLVISL